MTDSVVILGAGSLGAIYASRFYDLDPTCVSLAASGERYQRLKRDGLIVNQRHYPIPVYSPDDAVPPADLIIVAVKHHHLVDALPDVRNRVGDHTAILSVMNGLDSETVIAEHYGASKTLYCIAVGIDPLRSGNVVNYTTIGRLVFGEADNTILSARVKHIQQTFTLAGIPYDTPADMVRMMWWKFLVNVGVNQASAIVRAPYGVFQTDLHAQAIMEAAMREVIAVAEAAHVNLTPDDITSWYKVMDTLHPQGKTSMLQDVEAGRATEVDIFAGKMVELGELYGVPTPVNTLLLHAIKVIERNAK